MKRLTDQEFIDKIETIHGKNKIIPLESYINCRTKMRFKCYGCENEWITNPGNILSGSGCHKCGEIKAKNTIKWNLNTNDYLKRLNPEFLKKITVLSDYKKVNSPIKVKCNECGNEWDTKPSHLKREYGCKICGHNKRVEKTTLTSEDFIKKVNSIYRDDIIVLNEYKGNNHEIKFMCNKCGQISTKKRASGLLNRGCPFCVFSKGEKKIQTILDDNDILFKKEYKFNDLKDINYLRFDFAILDEMGNIKHLIEFDGKQHFESVKCFGGEQRYLDQLKKDKLKNDYCVKHNIKLIRIKYSDINKINIDLLINE
jgi:ribosomal protein S27E